jgi:chitodextrinase
MSRHRSVCIAVAGLCLGLLVNVAPVAAARDRTPPTTPGNLRITASTDTSVSLAWNASTDNSSNFWYCVQTNGGGCIRVNPPQTTLTRTKLLPEQTHTFSVYAIDGAGNRSANSNTVSHTTPPDTTPPSPPPTLTLTLLTPTRLSVSWPAPADNLSQVWTSLFVNGNAYFVDHLGPPNATVGGLTPATSYELQVTHRDASGNVVEGDVLGVTTPAATDTQPPTVPTNLRVSSSSYPPDIVLLWDQSTDDTDPQSQIGYEITLNGVPGGSVIGVGRAFFSCLAVGSTEIVMRAFDTSGNRSGPSNTVTFDCTEA